MQNDKSDKLTVVSRFVKGPAWYASLFFLSPKFSHRPPGFCFSYMSILVPMFALPNPPIHVKYLLNNLSQWCQSQTRNLVKMIPLRGHMLHIHINIEKQTWRLYKCALACILKALSICTTSHTCHTETQE